ncbi:hypothetical protein B0H19DRAFT_1080239 [Mycena capillaripes]|nr:hypothetical protein B0H19DRAFT_1080239 [Mycena capillaripes]
MAGRESELDPKKPARESAQGGKRSASAYVHVNRVGVNLEGPGRARKGPSIHPSPKKAGSTGSQYLKLGNSITITHVCVSRAQGVQTSTYPMCDPGMKELTRIALARLRAHALWARAQDIVSYRIVPCRNRYRYWMYTDRKQREQDSGGRHYRRTAAVSTSEPARCTVAGSREGEGGTRKVRM